jgi:hypothetical protein
VSDGWLLVLPLTCCLAIVAGVLLVLAAATPGPVGAYAGLLVLLLAGAAAGNVVVRALLRSDTTGRGPEVVEEPTGVAPIPKADR